MSVALASTSVANRLSELDHLVEWLAAWVTETGIEDPPAYKLRLVMEEMTANAVNYGFPSGRGGTLTVRVSANRELRLYQLVIEDDGEPFDPLTQADTGAESGTLEERPVGGLGLFLVRNVTSELTYERRDGRNILSVLIRD